MKIIFPENKILEDYVRNVLFYRKVEGSTDNVTYEGIFEFHIDRQSLGLNAREFAEFFRKVEVENGRKRKIGDYLEIRPFRGARIRTKIPKQYLSALKKVARHFGRNLSKHARFVTLEALREGIEAVGWPDHKLKPLRGTLEREVLKSAVTVRIRISREQHEILQKFTRRGGENISRFVRRNLIFDARRVLEILERTQTSESATRGG